MQVKVNDLSEHIEIYSSELKKKLIDVVESSWFLLGNETKAFEENFAKYIGTKYSVSVANGTDAIELSLRALGVKAADKVVTVANAGAYTTIALNLIGAIPVYVDIDESLNMNLTSLADCLEKNSDIKAVVVTHLYGNIAQVDKIVELCKKYSIRVLEDCAQAHGASLNGKKAGSWGDIASFSFYPTKNMGALGDAGAINSSDETLFNAVKKLKQYGWSSKYLIDTSHGRNSRMDEMQAGALNIFINHIDGWNLKRQKIAKRYMKGLKDLDLTLPLDQAEGSVFHLFIIRLNKRNELKEYLHENGVQTDIHYPVPDHKQEIMKNLDFIAMDLSKTEQYSSEIITLPCYPELSEDKIDYVIQKVKSFYAK